MMVIKRYILPILFALLIAFGGICFTPSPTHAMSSVIFAGYPDALNNANATEYNSVMGGHIWRSGTLGESQVVSTAGKIKSLRVELSAASGAGDDTYTFTLMYDGAASALTCAIVGAATSASDTTHEVDVVAGKLIILRVVSSGSPANAPNAQWSMVFSGTTTNESLILGDGSPSTVTVYFPLSQGAPSSTVADVGARQICPTAGKIKNLYLSSNSATGTSFTVTLYVNNTPTDLTAAVNCNGTANDTAHEVTVAAGDTLWLQCAATSVTVGGNMNFGMTFVADTDGESMILGSSNQSNHTSNTLYNSFSTSHIIEPWNATETTQQHLGQVCTLKNLYIYCATAPGAGKAFVFTVRNNANPTAITCTATGAATPTTANDTTHSVTLAAMDNIALECDPDANSPTVGQVKWGLVCYMYPAITNAPDTWTINGITGNSRISENTTYYSNPNGDTVAPNATVLDGDCRFTITNSSTTPIDLTVNFPSMAGGDASANSDNGTNNGTHFGAYSYFSGKTLASKVIAKSSGSAVAYSNLPSLTNILWGLEYISQTNAWTSGSAMSCNVTISATAH